MAALVTAATPAATDSRLTMNRAASVVLREQLAGAGGSAPFLFLWAILSGVGLAACGSGLRSAASFSGSSEPPIAGPAQIGEQPSLPDGYEALGRVVSSCTLISRATELEDEWLSDVDCSEARLVLALKEVAAEAGGELLIARKCSSSPIREHADRSETKVRCEATVARPGDALLGRRPLARRAEPPAGPPGVDRDTAMLLDEPSATAAWNIRVDFEPAAGAPRRYPRRTDLVGELSVMPVGQVRLGDVVARCSKGCAEAAVRSGVRVVGARMGASNVVGVRCVSTPDGLACTGTAAAYERDPATEPAL